MAPAAHAMNQTADMVRRCTGINVQNTDSYVLQCMPDDKIKSVIDDGVAQFFVADNDGDVRGTFLSNIPENDDYVYVHVIKNSPDTRYKDQICYRFITTRDAKRDGFYAVQVCEYERADYYL